MPLDDLPARFADALESAAARVRAKTADRLEGWIRAVLFVSVLMVLTLVSLVFVVIAAHRALSLGLGSAGSLATLGGLILAGGLFVWKRGSKNMRGG